jgi:hypothetical protein
MRGSRYDVTPLKEEASTLRPGKAEDPVALLRRPQSVGIVLQGKQLKFGRGADSHGPEAMPLRKIVDAGDDKSVGDFQILRTAGKPQTSGNSFELLQNLAAPGSSPRASRPAMM